MRKVKIFDASLEQFIASLEKVTIAKVFHTIDLLETFGHRLGLPHSKKISSSLYELRVRGAQEVRICYTFHSSKVILLHGFIKKSQKTPSREINVALSKLKRLDNV